MNQSLSDVIKSIFDYVKLDSEQRKNFTIVVLFVVLFFLVGFIINNKDADCDKNYKRLEENYNIIKAENIYLANGKTECFKSKDTLYTEYFKTKREIQKLKDSISNIKRP